jgi:hypothetical protein
MRLAQGDRVPESVYLEFTKTPDGVTAAAFEQWHETMARRLMAEPGVRALRRFTMAPDVGTIPPISYTHMTVYKGPDVANGARGFLGRRASERLGPPGDLPAGVRAASFYGSALEEPVDLARLDHVYLVLTKPPAEVSVPSFYDWYATHMRENLTAEGFDAAWRYRLERDVVDPLAPSDAVHAALYEVHGELPELRASLERAEADGRVIFPEWFPRMQLACLDCHAISDVVVKRRR